MRSTESDGETIDDAIAKALAVLHVGRDQVEIEILSDAAKRLFGFGGKKARVRATVRTPLAARLAESVSEASSPTPPNDSRETVRETRRDPVMPQQTRAPRRTAAALPADFVERARATLAQLLEQIGASCTVDARSGDEAGIIVLDVTGDSGGLLIGRRGQTLDAIEYVLNRILARDDEAGGRVIVDVERYRDRRREYLNTLAQRLAAKVKETGRPVTLNPMSPRDRRIVHLALQADPTVATRSHGDGHFRKMLIVPAERGRKGRARSTAT
jgi:spoIIIJ-associated protein